MNINKNDIITLELTGITSEGDAVGRYNGIAVFLPGGAVGDTVKAVVIKVKKTYAIAKILEILVASDDRIDSDCGFFPSCGGCVFRHISYDAELIIKKQRVIDCMEKLGGFSNIKINDTVSNSIIDGYRNKCQYPVGKDKNGKIITGFYSYHSHRIVECEKCKLHSDIFSDINDIFVNWANEFKLSAYDSETNSGLLRHLYIRHGEKTEEIAVCIVTTSKKVPYIDVLIERLVSYSKNIVSITLNINKKATNVILGDECITVHGRCYIYDILCGLKFKLSPLSFYQVNRSQAEVLYDIAKKYASLSGTETVLDMYCGTGTIGLSCCDKASQVIGVEIVPQAIDDANENAILNNISNARFICADAEKAAKQLEKEGIHADVIILDPPRKGCTEELIKTCVKMKPDRIVYVSCNPATQARDLKLLCELGYNLEEITPVNMFPRTAHVETVVLLSQRKPDDVIEVEIELDELDLTSSESKATYAEIKDYVLKEHGLKVSNLYISQVKRKCGIEVGENYNLPKSEDSRQPQCPVEKEKAIKDALEHFGMV